MGIEKRALYYLHLFHIPQSSIQNRNVHISVLNGGLWGMEQVHSGICEIGLLINCAYIRQHYYYMVDHDQIRWPHNRSFFEIGILYWERPSLCGNQDPVSLFCVEVISCICAKFKSESVHIGHIVHTHIQYYIYMYRERGCNSMTGQYNHYP